MKQLLFSLFFALTLVSGFIVHAEDEVTPLPGEDTNQIEDGDSPITPAANSSTPNPTPQTAQPTDSHNPTPIPSSPGTAAGAAMGGAAGSALGQASNSSSNSNDSGWLNKLVSPSFSGKPLNQIFNQLFYLGLLIAVVLAVIMIIRGGVEYMTTDAISGKENGKNRVRAAVGGLLLAFSTILILNTINPNITDLKIRFNEIKSVGQIGLGGGLTPRTRPGGVIIDPVTGLPLTPTGEGSINPLLTAYSPQGGGSQMEGGYESSIAGLDGQAIVRTLDDYANGRSSYVTLAGDPSLYRNSYIIPQITYVNSSGQTVTLNNVSGYVHDTGSAFTGKGTSRIDIPVGRDYSSGSLDNQPFSHQNIQFIPAK